MEEVSTTEEKRRQSKAERHVVQCDDPVTSQLVVKGIMLEGTEKESRRMVHQRDG